jgi:copper(I)-binding protein
MPHLRLALAAGGLLLAVPALASCGFDYPTERVNTVGAGVTDHAGEVDVAGALIVAGQSDSGTLIGALSNNSSDTDISLVSITGGEDGAVEADGFEPVELAPHSHVNLADLAEEEAGITVSGEFDAGDFVDVTFTFDNDESVSLEIPVMKPCHQYEGLDNTQRSTETEPLYTCAEDHTEAPAEH